MMQFWIRMILKQEDLQIIDTIRTKNTTYIDSFGNSSMSDDEKKKFNDFLSFR